jgi:hypothetical protein
MRLTKHQLKLLRFCDRYHTSRLTLPAILRAFWLEWLLLAVLAGLCSWFIWAGGPAVGWLYIGACFGAILRDVNRIIALLRTWPTLHEIIRWERVRELLESHEKDAA